METTLKIKQTNYRGFIIFVQVSGIITVDSFLPNFDNQKFYSIAQVKKEIDNHFKLKQDYANFKK